MHYAASFIWFLTCPQPTRAHHFPSQRSESGEKGGVKERSLSNTGLTSSIKTLSQRDFFWIGEATPQSSLEVIFFEDSVDTLLADDERPASAKTLGPFGFPESFSFCSCAGCFISGMEGIIVGYLVVSMCVRIRYCDKKGKFGDTF
jgi:hypothetical protein